MPLHKQAHVRSFGYLQNANTANRKDLQKRIDGYLKLLEVEQGAYAEALFEALTQFTANSLI